MTIEEIIRKCKNTLESTQISTMRASVILSMVIKDLEEVNIYIKSEYQYLLFVEDGSIDTDSLESVFDRLGIKLVVYRSGETMPKLLKIDREEEDEK